MGCIPCKYGLKVPKKYEKSGHSGPNLGDFDGFPNLSHRDFDISDCLLAFHFRERRPLPFLYVRLVETVLSIHTRVRIQCEGHISFSFRNGSWRALEYYGRVIDGDWGHRADLRGVIRQGRHWNR